MVRDARTIDGAAGGASRRACMRALAAVLVILTVILISIGAIVTSRDAGLAVPDWPLAYGRLNPPGWYRVANILAEHGHRLFGALVGFVTVVLAVLVLRGVPVPRIRATMVVAVVAVVAQGLLGGLTVRLKLPPWVSIAHACLAQTFLCLTVALATDLRLLGRSAPEALSRAPAGLRRAAAAAVIVVFVQLLLGALVRHGETWRGQRVFQDLHGELLATHIGGAALVVILIVRLRGILRRAGGAFGGAAALLPLLAVQVGLGIAAALLVFGKGQLASPTFPEVAIPTAHVATGAVILATILSVALKARRAAVAASAGRGVSSAANQENPA